MSFEEIRIFIEVSHEGKWRPYGAYLDLEKAISSIKDVFPEAEKIRWIKVDMNYNLYDIDDYWRWTEGALRQKRLCRGVNL